MRFTRPLILSLAIALLFAFAPSSTAQSITIEQLMSSPFPSELISSKRGDKIAWVFYQQGKRNIWLAEAPGFASRQLTHMDIQNGQDVTAPIFSPNGNSIAFVRGGNKNQNGEVANPTSDVAGA